MNKLQWNFNQNRKFFIHKKGTWKCRLRNGAHFVQGRWVKWLPGYDTMQQRILPHSRRCCEVGISDLPTNKRTEHTDEACLVKDGKVLLSYIVRYILSSVWVRLSRLSLLSSIRSIIQDVGLCVFSLPTPRVMIEIIYILCLIIIIKSEVWTITHCLGLGHGTMVCAVCLSIFLLYSSALCQWVFDNGGMYQCQGNNPGKLG